ncbi:MAG: D-alanine--D-alanine ligase [Bacteroidales bacterium]
MKKIAVLFGGNSGEFDVSAGSGRVVASYLEKEGYKAYLICVKGSDWFYEGSNKEKISIDKNDFTLTLNQERIDFDCVFNAIHGDPGENGRIEGYFEIMNIPCTSSGVTSSALTFHKNFCNRVVKSYGIKVADSIIIRSKEEYSADDVIQSIGLPCFVKPCSSGSSVGVTKVKAATELPLALNKVFEVDEEAMIESFTKGREFGCGVVELDGKLIALPLTEIISENDFFDYEAKYTKGKALEVTPPENLNLEAENNMKHISVILYRELACQGFVRFDYILPPQSNEPVFLEVNTIPGLSVASIIPQQVSEYGMELGKFFTQIVEDTLKRR